MDGKETSSQDNETREYVESALMHFCELAVAGDPEAELSRSTDLLLTLITQQVTQARLDELLHVYDGDALYFYDDKEDHTSISKRIKELKDKENL